MNSTASAVLIASGVKVTPCIHTKYVQNRKHALIYKIGAHIYIFTYLSVYVYVFICMCASFL